MHKISLPNPLNFATNFIFRRKTVWNFLHVPQGGYAHAYKAAIADFEYLKLLIEKRKTDFFSKIVGKSKILIRLKPEHMLPGVSETTGHFVFFYCQQMEIAAFSPLFPHEGNI